MIDNEKISKESDFSLVSRPYCVVVVVDFPRTNNSTNCKLNNATLLIDTTLYFLNSYISKYSAKNIFHACQVLR